MRRYRLLAAAALILPLLASMAASSRAVAQDSTKKAADAAKPKRRSNVISEDEIAALGGAVQNALGLVQRLRPAMLRSRASSTTSGQSDGNSSMDAAMPEVQVYFDNQKMGGINALADIALAQIREIRYLNASDATTLFGTGNTAGAIQVIGKR
jgi:hypothetical protein